MAGEPSNTPEPDDAGRDDVLPPTPREQVMTWLGEPRSYRLTRSLLLRLLGVVYLFAFLGIIKQGLPLIGHAGLTPADQLPRDFWAQPGIFAIDCSDSTLIGAAWLGFVLSAAVVAGYANAPIMLVLWILYSSFERVGQLWWAFGWEIQLLETGFLAIFLAPPLDPRPTRSRPPSFIVIVLYRWLTFRIMLGAGLIKLRGDACWRDLSCLDHHFETQPIPNPFSAWFHHAPHWIHAFGVLFNHVVELVGPWLVMFGRRWWRLGAALGMIAFQLTLVVSGNLAFLNWLTLVPIIACLDDDALRWLLRGRLRRWVDRRLARANAGGRDHVTRRMTIVAACLAVLVGIKSLDVVVNLLSSHQAMNRSYDRLALVNTYGAFGSVGDTRRELIIEGTRDEAPGPDTVWQPYELPCKPGDVERTPCVLGPYHLRLDWLIWFAAMYDAPNPRYDHSWFVVLLIHKLLLADPGARSLLASDPFGDEPPQWIRVRRFRYRFASGDSSAVWVRDQEEMWLDPVSLLDFAPPDEPSEP